MSRLSRTAVALGLVALAGMALAPAQDATVTQPGSIGGYVYGALPGGVVPLPGAMVVVCNPQFMAHRVTDAEGAYLFEQVPPGTYHMMAWKQGFLRAEATVQVAPGQQVAQDFTLQPVQPPPPPPGTIGGIVRGVTPAGIVPLENAIVRLMGPGFMRETRTEADGSYLFANVRPGTYRMAAAKEGFAPQQVTVNVGPGQSVTQDFTLQPMPPPPGAFAGLVLGQHGGQQMPLPGAIVTLFDQGEVVRRVQTDRMGRFNMPNVPPGTYTARAEKMGWQPAEVEVEIVSGQVTQHTFILNRL